MKTMRLTLVLCAAAALCALMAGCGTRTSAANQPAPMPTTHTLTVNSANPAKGVPILVSPNDILGSGNGSSGFTRGYLASTTVTLTAPIAYGGNKFKSWDGCNVTIELTCTVAMDADTAVTANYVAAETAATTPPLDKPGKHH